MLSADNCRDSWTYWQSTADWGITWCDVTEPTCAQHRLHSTVISHVEFFECYLWRRASYQVATEPVPSFRVVNNKILLKNVLISYYRTAIFPFFIFIQPSGALYRRCFVTIFRGFCHIHIYWLHCSTKMYVCFVRRLFHANNSPHSCFYTLCHRLNWEEIPVCVTNGFSKYSTVFPITAMFTDMMFLC